mmetsp:Transcript_70184/g.153024  ORF Transcript_70184/g.153024 Transcript_70184/m.153024 type:complete len:165 (-) Transcript_70184:72-566(-)
MALPSSLVTGLRRCTSLAAHSGASRQALAFDAASLSKSTASSSLARSFVLPIQVEVGKKVDLPWVDGQSGTAIEIPDRRLPLWVGLEPGADEPPCLLPAVGDVDGEMPVAPLECGKWWHQIIKSQRNAIKYIENASKADCGPKKKHWRWYRDRMIKMRKKQKCI